MTDKYEALRKSLADVAKGATLARIHTFRDHADIDTIRALLAERDALCEALQRMVDDFDGCYAESEPAMIKARAALAQHQGEKHVDQ